MDAYKKLQEKVSGLKKNLYNEERRIAEYNLLLSMQQTKDMEYYLKGLLKSAVERYRLLRIEIENLEWLLK
ncbi:MAG: hypothetical protein JWN78_2643 [Bacteroidota bacterium]|nr:hypothetical protein [Bacteroidota bacterium]